MNEENKNLMEETQSEIAEDKKGVNLSVKMLIAMVLGLALGVIIGEPILVIKPFGTAFVNLLKMCMVPIVFVSITLSVGQVEDFKEFGRIGGRMFVQFMFTTIMAAILGTVFALIIKPGVGFSAEITGEVAAREAPTVSEVLLGIIPTNIFSSLASGDLLPILFFSVLLGISLILIGEKKKPVVDVLQSSFEAIMKMITICLKYAPIGVFALMACLGGQYGLDVLKPLAKFYATEYLVMTIQILVVYGFVLAVLAKVNIFKFLARAKDCLIIAFSTVSGAAAVPVELEQAETHFGIPDRVASFGLVIGSTVNQDGAALNIPICVIFVGQIYGFEFTVVEMITIIAMGILMSCGSSGVPASASVFTLMILTRFGIPVEAFSMVLGTYIIIDVYLTTVNVAGDIVCVMAACEKEGILDRKVWDDPNYNANEALRLRKSAK